MKFSLLFSLCLLVIFVVAVAALYFALDALGVFDSINRALLELTATQGTGGTELVASPQRVLTIAAGIGLLNVVVFTALATLAAFLYNLCSDIVGGIEVVLAETD